MNNKITTSGLAAMIALATGKQKQLCEDFVSSLFRIVEHELKKGENVRIKGFGTFKLIDVEPRKSVNVATGEDYEIPGHTKVIFVMAKELASIVNAPFDAFETVEISDEIPTDSLDGDVEVPEDELVLNDSIDDNDAMEETDSVEEDEDLEPILPVETMATSESTKVVDGVEPIMDTVTSDDVEEDTSDEVEASADEGSDDKVSRDESYLVDEDANDDEDYEEEGESFWKRYKFAIGFIAGVCASLLIGWLVIGFTDFGKLVHINKGDLANADGVEVAKGVSATEQRVSDSMDVASTKEVADSIVSDDKVNEKDDVPTRPSDTPVYDTVTTTRYLTTIAREHYGNFNLWPIIYEENAAILGHPDRIRPGTKVVVPPLSKYNIDPKNKEQIKAIKQKGNAIYAKYK